MFQTWINFDTKIKKTKDNTEIFNQTDFIFKIRNKFIQTKNEKATLMIQTWYRMIVARIAFR